MKRLLAIFLLFATVVPSALVATAPSTARADVSAAEVRRAIDRAVRFLKSTQNPNGTWIEIAGQEGGVTSLVTLSLLNAGVPVDDPAIQKALRFIRTIKPGRTYATSLQTMVLCTAEPRRDIQTIKRNVDWLVATQVRDGSPYQGGWGYGNTGVVTGKADNSNAQFALLALHEASRVGVYPENNQVWYLARNYWKSGQRIDGSWAYLIGQTQTSTGSMTCAGLSALVIIADKIDATDAAVVEGRVSCCRGEKSDIDTRIEKGRQWLGKNFSVARNPGTATDIWLYYYLYGLERVGRLTARRHFENVSTGTKYDWYREGCDFLVRTQDQMSGFWTGTSRAEERHEIGTALGLLFLSKGRRPTVIAKLRHAPLDDWDSHRRDIANLTSAIEKRWKMDLTWQVVDLRSAGVEDLLQSPVLYYSGSKSPVTDADLRATAEKLRTFLDRGGFIIAEAQCGGTGFDQGFRRLIATAFPEPEYALRPIQPEHPIWSAEQNVPPDQVRLLYGLEYGCRTSIVYSPPQPAESGGPRPSLSCLWELRKLRPGQSYPPEVQAQVNGAEILGANILAYATGRRVAGKEAAFDVREAPRADTRLDRGRLTVAKLRHAGGCDAAPRALVHLLENASKELKIRAAAEEELIRITDDALYTHHLVFMHGRNQFRLTDLERRRLKAYIERGGTLFGDAICASTPFTQSMATELAKMFPDHPVVDIPTDDPIYSTRYGGYDLQTVSWNQPGAGGTGEGARTTTSKGPPRMKGIRIDDRWAVIYSPLDISCALERHNSLDCKGYTREDAARIAINVVIYTINQ